MNHHQKELVSEEEMDDEMKKFCADCKTTKTPLWRGGPAGPKSLCNACGIRYRKKRSAILGLNKGPEKRKDKPASITTSTNTAAAAKKVNSSGGSGKGGNLSEDLRVRLVALGKEVVMLQRQRSPMKRQRSNRSRRRSKGSLGEEEQAAVLLMALSCGSVFA